MSVINTESTVGSVKEIHVFICCCGLLFHILGALLVGVLRVENSEVKSYTVRRNVSSKVQQVSWVTDSYLQSQYNNISLNINNISY